MDAAVVTRYGPPDVVAIEDRPRPVPGKGEVLVRIAAAAVTAGDARLRAGRFPRGFGLPARVAMGFTGPRVRVLGNSFSGTVTAVESGVTDVAVGDEVAGMTGARMRAHAEFAVAPVRSLALKPAEVSFEDAAGVIFGGTTALHFLRDRAEVVPGESVLVNGASGAVGSAAVQVARHLGGEVTAVASARNHAFVRSLGAHHVVDYAETPVETLDERYDVVIDTVGNISRSTGERLRAEGGRLVLVVADLGDTIGARGKVFAGPAPEKAEHIALLLGLVATGELRAVTEVCGGLDALPSAYRVIDSGHKVGNLVVVPAAAS